MVAAQALTMDPNPGIVQYCRGNALLLEFCRADVADEYRRSGNVVASTRLPRSLATIGLATKHGCVIHFPYVVAFLTGRDTHEAGATHFDFNGRAFLAEWGSHSRLRSKPYAGIGACGTRIV